jgi:hypothetical protein
MEEVVSVLKLCVDGWKDAESVMGTFFNCYRAGETDYDANLFCLAGILLSNAVRRDKAQVLLEIADPFHTRTIKCQAFSDTLEALIGIALDFTPGLVKDETVKNEYDHVKVYVGKLV